jgi:DNA-binding response OmpR family regulator
MGYLENGHIVSDAFADFLRQQGSTNKADLSVRETMPTIPKGLWIDAKSGNAYLDGNLISPPLTKHQFRLLELLCENKGKICDNTMIVNAVWGLTYIDKVYDQAIAALTSRLRKRVEQRGKPWRYVITVFGRGLTLGDGTPSSEPGNV